MSLKKINRRLTGKVELERGNGYHYFIFDRVDDVNVYETHTIYLCYTNQQSDDRWVAEGEAFYEREMAKLREVGKA
jgi:serine protease inhibitor ecotin